MSGELTALALLYGQLSLLAFGGGQTVLPEMQRQVVEVHGWMSAREFAALFALAQAAPGPNMLVSTLIGWRVAGFFGALVATLGIAMPSGLLTLAVASFWFRFRDAPWRRLIQAGIVPVTGGLIMAAAMLLCQATTLNWRHGLLTLAAAAVLLATTWHPLLVLAAGAALGAVGVLG